MQKGKKNRESRQKKERDEKRSEFEAILKNNQCKREELRKNLVTLKTFLLENAERKFGKNWKIIKHHDTMLENSIKKLEGWI